MCSDESAEQRCTEPCVPGMWRADGRYINLMFISNSYLPFVKFKFVRFVLSV